MLICRQGQSYLIIIKTLQNNIYLGFFIFKTKNSTFIKILTFSSQYSKLINLLNLNLIFTKTSLYLQSCFKKIENIILL
ncbi:MAG: hypothetical protein EAZ51_07460 [Sphingobacteriales bacterium]|nr:MAG: hypothetical protein EAZ64_03660 [Sphingobacteriales bacterium]TAF79653.1 MAG: hypothetical protein EAZ51_07460 [Sphingobacteriales bacterium]